MRRPENFRMDLPERPRALGMKRRTFTQLMAAGLAAGQTTPPGSPPAGTPAATLKWPDEIYRRLLVATHVPDWDPVLLSPFDPRYYVATIARSGFQCLMPYAISCAGLGLCLTKIATVNRG